MTYENRSIEKMHEQRLQAAVAHALRQGWVVQTYTPEQVILTKDKRIGWFWNTILILITGGLWLIPVAYWVLNRKQLTRIISIDTHGQIHNR